MNVKLNHDKTAAVATDYEWLPIDANTPRGVKLQLLTNPGGVAIYGELHEKTVGNYLAWAPCPRKPDWLKPRGPWRAFPKPTEPPGPSTAAS